MLNAWFQKTDENINWRKDNTLLPRNEIFEIGSLRAKYKAVEVSKLQMV